MLFGYELLTGGSYGVHQQPIELLGKRGCQKIVTDVCASRPYFKKLLEEMQSGDVLVVLKLDRLGTTLKLIIQVVEHLLGKNVTIESLEEKISISGSDNLEPFLKALVDIEQRINALRVEARMKTVKKRGGKTGRDKALNSEDIQAIKHLIRQKKTIKSICEHHQISRTTYYKYFPSHKRK